MKEFPEDFLRNLEEALPHEFEGVLRSLQEKPEVSIRLNPNKKVTLQFQNLKQVEWCPSGYYLNERPNFSQDPNFHSGSYYVQEASSMMLWKVLEFLYPQNVSNHQILDICAAPGGKSTLLQSFFGNENLIIANEIDRKRTEILNENAAKWGAKNLWVTSNPSSAFSNIKGQFNCILLDAPCSGEGMFRKDDFAIQQWSNQLIQSCIEKQSEILENLWPCLQENGFLIYATCTFNRKENEENLANFCEKHHAESISLKHLEEFGACYSLYNEIHALRMLPGKVRGEGLFISVLKKKDSATNIVFKEKKNQFKIRFPLQVLQDQNQFLFEEYHDAFHAIDLNFVNAYHRLKKHVYFLKIGVKIGQVKYDKFIPDAALALSQELDENSFEKIELSKNEALAYLNLQTVHKSNSKKGYQLVCFNSLPLGWINNVGSRSNNLYPKYWKLRQILG